MVMHPSHHAARRWLADPPTTTERIRPVFRWNRRLSSADAFRLITLQAGSRPLIIDHLRSAKAVVQADPG